MTELLIKEVRDGNAQDAHENHVFFVDGETVTGEAFDAAYVAVKSKDNAPEKGATSAWDLSQSDKGFRLRRAQQQQGGFRGGGGRTPEDQERIVRAVALKAAVDLAPKDGSVKSTDVVAVAKTFLPFLRGDD